ncbi:MAG: prolipoprotein diacylglyceryl transferase family protein [Geodermatophilaceae bacterium]
MLEDEVVAPHGCAGGILADADPQGLAASYTFDTSGWAAPGPVAIAFAGTRLDGTGQPADRFERVERIPDLGPRSGRVTITARIQRLEPGRWRVIAGPVQTDPERPLPRKAIVASTQLALLAQGPGVRLLAWPALVGLGAVVAVLLQALLVQRAGLPAPTVVGLSVLGGVLGYPGGKLWYLAANRRPPSEFLAAGACIQGFLLVALLVVSLGSFLLDLSVGVILDATAPGIFFGMAIGRPGCFLTGCCAGRPTMSRWGLWSSDRRLGIRRVPVQLVEAAVALLIGLVSLLLVLAVDAPFAGAIFVGAIAAYTFCRQILFRLRSQSHTRVGRLVTQVLCASILAALVVAFVIG